MDSSRKFLRIANWLRIQNPKRMNKMPWTRLHRDWLEDYEFTSLSLTNRGVLFCLHMLAARSDNRIPFEQRWIASKIGARPQVVGKAIVTLMRVSLIEEFVEDVKTGKNKDLLQVLGDRSTPLEEETETNLEIEGALTFKEKIPPIHATESVQGQCNTQPNFELLVQACIEEGLRGSDRYRIADLIKRNFNFDPSEKQLAVIERQIIERRKE